MMYMSVGYDGYMGMSVFAAFVLSAKSKSLR
jgi:hypothetical protein